MQFQRALVGRGFFIFWSGPCLASPLARNNLAAPAWQRQPGLNSHMFHSAPASATYHHLFVPFEPDLVLQTSSEEQNAWV